MRIRSDHQKTSALSSLFMGLGGLIIWLVKNNPDPRPSIHWAYVVGLFLISSGVYFLLMTEKVVITTNETRKGLQVKRQSLIHQLHEFIPYSDVESVHSVRVGRRAGLKTYHLVLRLKQGKRLTPGRWSKDPSEINRLAHELAQEIGCDVKEAPVYGLPNIKTALIAGLGSIGIYALWYQFTVGRVCLAMWHGNAPAIIVPFTFILLLYTFRPRSN